MDTRPRTPVVLTPEFSPRNVATPGEAVQCAGRPCISGRRIRSSFARISLRRCPGAAVEAGGSDPTGHPRWQKATRWHGMMVGRTNESRLRSRRFSHRTVLGVVAVILVATFAAVWIHESIVGRLYYAVRGHLANIYRAIQAYDRQHGHLPPVTPPSADKPPISWRIEVAACYALLHATDYDHEKPWDDPSNLRLEDTSRWWFMYKPDGGQRDLSEAYGRREPAFPCLTYFQAITGTDTAFAPGVSHSLKELPNDLILVVRVEESNVHWMEPVDLLADDLVRSEEAKPLLLGNNGYAVLFADGETWVLSRRLPYGDLCKFFTIDGAKQCERDTLLGPYRIRPWFSGLDEIAHPRSGEQ
jgi:hypothetical protein